MGIRNLDGAALELRSAFPDAGGQGYVPLQVFGLEDRADATTNLSTPTPDNLQSITPRVFSQSSIEYLGVSTPTVPVGTASFPRLSQWRNER